MQEPMLTPDELSARWRITPKTLANWRNLKKGPPYIKLGGQRNQRVFYRLVDIQEFERKSMRYHNEPDHVS